MKQFPKDIKFKYSWRGYQERVLAELDTHITDRHLHVVAPPGSGKTVLGLEVMLRLNKPTLILAPTITIRNQWIQRLCESFLPGNSVPEWVSVNIRKPAFLTVTTYQGLHVACSQKGKAHEPDEEYIPGEEGYPEETIRKISTKQFQEITRELQRTGIKTIVIDEAHHLRNEWCNTLIKVKEKLNPVTIGLTATPPFDVSYKEWKRYIELNGPIDAEIAVPELVKAGDLCPHQDYVYFSYPSPREYDRIIDFREKRDLLVMEIKESGILTDAFGVLPAWNDPKNDLEWIYSNFSVYTSMLIFFNDRGIPVPEIHFKVVAGEKTLTIPPLEFRHMEILVGFFLFSKTDIFQNFKEEKSWLYQRLKQSGIMEKNRVCFHANAGIDRIMVSSRSKMGSITEIVRNEYASLGNNLRMVILTDYIRSENMYCEKANLSGLNRFGVLPVFHQVRHTVKECKKIGVLTGSVILIPRTACDAFREICNKYSLAGINDMLQSYNDDYLLITPVNSIRNRMVAIITDIFSRGEIEALVGTSALLAEGWDAPCINSLIMANFGSSFVLSNQMRGRAIRSQKSHPGKCSNIWHLVCLDPLDCAGGNDLKKISKRFRSFVGVSNEGKPIIENGIGRLKMEMNEFTPENTRLLNEITLSHATNRKVMRQRWEEAIDGGVNMVEELRLPSKLEKDENPQELSRFYLRRTIAWLVADLSIAFSAFSEIAFNVSGRYLRYFRSEDQRVYFIFILFGAAVVFLGRKTWKTLRLYLKYRDISKDIHRIGEALVGSLAEYKLIHTPQEQLNVVSYADEYGAVFCHLAGANTFEQSLFTECLEEITGLIDNPRYIITRQGSFFTRIRKDYHPVPEVLGKNKYSAGHFYSLWKEKVGNCTLTYTRTLEGRKHLLHARLHSLSAWFEDNKVPEQVNRWR